MVDMTRLRDYGMKLLIFLISGPVVAVAMNGFLIPNEIFSAGFTGIAQLISIFMQSIFGLNVDVGVVLMAFNFPLALIGWFYAGRQFTILSFLQNLYISFVMIAFPTVSVVHDEPILAALFGGLLLGSAVGMTFKYGFSTGGMDIIAMAVQKTTGRSIGSISLTINAFIVLSAGAFIGWQNAMYTIIGIYATAAAIDAIHTRHQKLTVFIVTQHADEVGEALQNRLIRGITVMPSMGAFSHQPSSTLMMVLSRYELKELTEVVKAVDGAAFINVVSTVDVPQGYYTEDLQSQIRSERLAAQSQIEEALNLSEATQPTTKG